MCWPEADKHWEDYLKADGLLTTHLTDLLIFKQDRHSKYVKIYDESSSDVHVRVWLQRKTQNIVKVAIDFGVEGKRYGNQVVDIYAEDPAIHTELTELTLVSDIKDGIEQVREIMYADQIIGKLTYGS